MSKTIGLLHLFILPLYERIFFYYEVEHKHVLQLGQYIRSNEDKYTFITRLNSTLSRLVLKMMTSTSVTMSRSRVVD